MGEQATPGQLPHRGGRHDACLSRWLCQRGAELRTHATLDWSDSQGSTHSTAVSQAETLAVTLDLAAPQEPGQIAGRVA